MASNFKVSSSLLAASTNSIAFPNMFDVARNTAAIAEDLESVTNRVRLLILTEPTELYMNPTFGVGLKQYMFQYNTDNTIAQIKDRIIDQLRLWEPCVVPELTTVTRGLTCTGSQSSELLGDPNHLELTVSVTTKFGELIEIGFDDSNISGG